MVKDKICVCGLVNPRNGARKIFLTFSSRSLKAMVENISMGAHSGSTSHCDKDSSMGTHIGSTSHWVEDSSMGVFILNQTKPSKEGHG